MKLHTSTSDFKEIIEAVAEDMNLLPFQVEKDYYVSLMLKEIAKINDLTIVFKGGTSLSKCYDIIERFSEDIGLAVKFEGNQVSYGNRKKLKEGLKKVISNLGFEFINESEVESNKEYNRYEVGYQKLFGSSDIMLDHILIETIIVYKPYPCEKHQVSNYITKYLERNHNQDLIIKYDLEPFEMTIQTINRTLIDKVFAICDYHLLKNYTRHSRHIYDIHKIWTGESLDKHVVRHIIKDVIRDRQLYGTQNVSCNPSQKPINILWEIYNQSVYKRDYDDITSSFIYKTVTYERAIESIREIIESNLIPEIVEDYRSGQ